MYGYIGIWEIESSWRWWWWFEYDVFLLFDVKVVVWIDENCGMEVCGKMFNLRKGSGGIMGYRFLGLCCVKEVVINLFIVGGVKKCWRVVGSRRRVEFGSDEWDKYFIWWLDWGWV